METRGRKESIGQRLRSPLRDREKGEEDKPCPKGREPNPELMGGEGIEPYELYSHDLYSLERLMAEQACAWYMMADIRVYDRRDEVIHPPKPPFDTLKEREEEMKQEKETGKTLKYHLTLIIPMFLHMVLTLRILDTTLGSTFSLGKGGTREVAS